MGESTCPVMKALSSDARKYRYFAISSGDAILPRGVSSKKALLSAPASPLFMSVSTAPGARQFTLTPEGASSLASALVKAITAPLDAEYTASQDAPASPHIEATVMIFPVFLE
jgi:hypothetical protein